MPGIDKTFAAALLAVSLAGGGLAQAQSPPAPGAAGQPQAPGRDMPHGMPMQGGMTHGQGDAMQGGCPMMRRSAAMEERVRRLEERLGIPAPTPPARPGAPG